MKRNPNEVKEVLDELKAEAPDADYRKLEDALNLGCDMRDKIFDVAGVDPAVIQTITKKMESNDYTVEEICSLIAPVIHEVLNVEVDPENSEPGQMKFKKKRAIFWMKLACQTETQLNYSLYSQNVIMKTKKRIGSNSIRN